MTDQISISAAQLERIGKETEKALASAIERMGLRKYAVEAALKIPGISPNQIENVSRQLYEFMTEPAADIKVSIGP